MILAILQARVSSTRLPGKVLKPILGVPMILRQIERIQQAKKIDKLVVATSRDASDDMLVDLCNLNKIDCFRGSLHDVLDRFYQTAKVLNPKHIVRLTGDCPLMDSGLLDRVIAYHIEHDFDITGSDMTQYPDGLDVEIVKFSILEQAWREAKLLSEREHVTPYIWKAPDVFKQGVFSEKMELAHLRWTVDEQEDFELVHHIYENLYPVKPHFQMKDILSFLEEHPSLKTLNTKYKRNEGYDKSLLEDQKFLKELEQ